MTEKTRGRPTVGAERNGVLRILVKAIVQKDYDGNLTATARALNLSTSALSGFVSGSRGAGPKLMDALVVYLRRTQDQILASGGDLATLRQGAPATTSTTGAPVAIQFGKLPNWPELLATAQTILPTCPAWVWEKLATSVLWFDGPITAASVAACANVVLNHAAPPVKKS
jgi:hypothetical protein